MTIRPGGPAALTIGMAPACLAPRSGVTQVDHGCPQWRGPLLPDEAPGASPPIERGATRNLRWKTPSPCRIDAGQ